MPSDFEKNKPVYYLAVFAFLFYVLLKLPLWIIVAVTLQALIFLSPLLVLLTVGGLYLWRSGKDPERKLLIRKDYLALTAKLLLVILAFYLFYTPGTLPALLLSLAGFIKVFFTLDSFFFLFGYILTIVTVGAGVFLAVRAFQKSRGLYPRSVSELIRRTLYALFLVYLLFFASSALAYPEAYAPFTSTLGDILYTYSGGSIKVLNGSDNYAYKKLGSLTQAAQALTASIGETKAGLTTTLNQNSLQFRQNLAVTQDTLSENLAKTQKNLSDQLSTDINTRLDTGGGTLGGDLKVKGKLQATDNLTVQGVDLTGDDITALLNDLTDYNNPNHVTAAQVGLGNVIDVAQVPLSYLDTDPTLAADSDSRVASQKAVKSYVDGQTVASNLWQLAGNVISPKNSSAILGLGSNTLTLTGNASLNQNLGTGASPTFAGLTLTNALAVGSGGTGAESFSSNYLLKGNGTGALESSVIYDNGTDLGIGTNSPNALLDIFGSDNALRLSYDSSNYSTLLTDSAGELQVESSSVYDASLTLGSNDANNVALIFDNNSNFSDFYAGVDSSDNGKFKIGLLAQNAFLTINPLSGGLSIGADYASVASAPTNGMLVEGSVGIGTTSPSGMLDVGDGNLNVSNAGNVGIGTTSPNAMLDIFGTNNALQLSYDSGDYTTLSTDSTGELQVKGGSVYDASLTLGSHDANNVALIFDNSDNSQNFYVGVNHDNGGQFQIGLLNQGPFMTVLPANGNVGIGTTNPQYTLDVNGSVGNYSGALNLYAGGTDQNITLTPSGSGYTILNGNVGIGTTSPTAALQVMGSVCVNAAGGACLGNSSGTIYADNFIVNSTGTVPDYVFQSNYQLMPLADLQTYVQTYSHLPDVPSAEDIQKNGLNTGNMILDILQQTEQNVLYIIGNHNDIQTLSQLVSTNQQGEATDVANLQASLSTAQTTLTQEQSVISSLNDQALSTGNKIALIGTTLSQITANQTNDESKLKAVSDTLDSQAQTITTLQTDLQTLQGQMATLQEENQSVIDFATALNLKSLIYKDAEGDLDLGAGQLKAAGVETGRLTLQGPFIVKVTDQEAQNIGQAAICPAGQVFSASSGQCADTTDSTADGTATEVKTTAVDQNSKIYITPTGSTGNQVLYVNQVDPGSGFSVKIDNPTKTEIDFNWWVVEDGNPAGNVSAVSSAEATGPTGSSQPATDTQQPATGPSASAGAGDAATNQTNATTNSTDATTSSQQQTTANSPDTKTTGTGGGNNDK